MRGLSASGKTTLAKTLGGVRISRDDIRRLLFGIEGKSVLSNEQEQKVTKFQRDWIERELLAGNNVVIDDTNLNKGVLTSLCRFVNDLGFDFEIVDVQASVSKARARNKKRPVEDWVPEHVILRQAKRAWWGQIESVPYVYKAWEPDKSLPAAFSFDLDGTLAQHTSGRSPYDATRYHEDTPHKALLELDTSLYQDFHILILTGRGAEHREACVRWLWDKGIAYDDLIMRPEGDTRNDAVVKSDLWDEHVAPNYNVLMHFDDRNRVVNALRRKGIPVAQVSEGSF